MKLVALGDTHGRNFWTKIVEKESDADKIVFIGDYFDTHEGISPLEQVRNFENILSYKSDNPDKVVLLIGNHDYHYMPFSTERYSGYRAEYSNLIGKLLGDNLDKLQMSYSNNDVMYSHAGITNQFLKIHGLILGTRYLKFKTIPQSGVNNLDISEKINSLWENNPQAFKFNGYDPYGDNITQSCIWVRPGSLVKNSIDMKQVVGHTTQSMIKSKHINDKRDMIWCIDTLGTSGEYLVVNGDTFTPTKYE